MSWIIHFVNPYCFLSVFQVGIWSHMTCSFWGFVLRWWKWRCFARPGELIENCGISISHISVSHSRILGPSSGLKLGAECHRRSLMGRNQADLKTGSQRRRSEENWNSQAGKLIPGSQVWSYTNWKNLQTSITYLFWTESTFCLPVPFSLRNPTSENKVFSAYPQDSQLSVSFRSTLATNQHFYSSSLISFIMNSSPSCYCIIN